MNVFLRIGLMSALLPASAMNSAVYAGNSDSLSGSVCFGNSSPIVEQDMTKSLFVGALGDHHFDLLKGPAVKPGTALISSSDDEEDVFLDDTYTDYSSDEDCFDDEDGFILVETPENRRLKQMDMLRDLNGLVYGIAIKDKYPQEKIDRKLGLTTEILERLDAKGYKVRGFSGLTGTTKNIGWAKSFFSGLVGIIKADKKIIFDTPGVTAFKGTDMHVAFRGTHLKEGWGTNLYSDAVEPLNTGIAELISFFRLQADEKPLTHAQDVKLLEVVDTIFHDALSTSSDKEMNQVVEVCLHALRNYSADGRALTSVLSKRQWNELHLNISDLAKALKPIKGIKFHAGFYTKFITSLPSLRQHFLEHYRTLTSQEITSSVLRMTGHSKGAALAQVFGALSRLAYIWQAEVLREKGDTMTAAMVENTSNGRARRVKMHVFSCPSAVYGSRENVEALARFTGADDQFLIQNVTGDIVAAGPKKLGFSPLGTEIFEDSVSFIERLLVNDNIKKSAASPILHRHYGGSNGFAHDEVTGLDHTQLATGIKEAKKAKKKSWWKWS